MRQPGVRQGLTLTLFLFFAATASQGDDAIRFPGCSPGFVAPAPAQGVAPGGGPGTYLGSDAGFACPLDRQTTFWTLCDVAIGPIGARTRDDSTNKKNNLAIGNTIALTTCRDGKFTVQHYFRGSSDNPLPFFPDPNNRENVAHGTRLWPRRAFVDEGKLYVFAQQIADPGAVYNTWIIRVENPHDRPDRWQFVYLTLGQFPIPKIKVPTPASVIHFGSDAVLSVPDGYVYTYGIELPLKGAYEGNFQMTALRIPLAALRAAKAWDDLGPKAESMTREFNVWKPGLHDRNDRYLVGIPAFNAFSVRYNARLKLWQAVYGDDRSHGAFYAGFMPITDIKVKGVYVMAGPTPFGPWGKPELVATYPEMDPTRVNQTRHPYNADSYGYFVNELPAFEANDAEITFTYSIGSYRLTRHHDYSSFQVDMKQYTIESWTAPNPLLAPGRAQP